MKEQRFNNTEKYKRTLYNVLGQKTETLLDEIQDAGTHKIVWKPGGLPSGMYFCRIQTGDFMETIRLNFRK
ncbi:T9SS type A sorting domain-containing protein [candidate division KSB1 bacterium]|nr:T9SS type A sorting domain-containing protein [candidate division KSB1 bacterium]